MTSAQALFKMSVVKTYNEYLDIMICRQNFRSPGGRVLKIEFCHEMWGDVLIQSIDCPENRMLDNVLFLRGSSYLKDNIPLGIRRIDAKLILEALMWGKPSGFDDTLNEVRFKL